MGVRSAPHRRLLPVQRAVRRVGDPAPRPRSELVTLRYRSWSLVGVRDPPNCSAVFSIVVTILAVPREQSVLVPDVVSTIIAQAATTLQHGRRTK